MNLDKLKLLLLTGLLFFASVLQAKPYKRTNNFSSYKDPLNEIGYGINAVYQQNENKLAPLLHFYYSRYFSNYFSIGANYYGLYTKDFHNALSAKISFRILNNLVLSLKPGIYLKNVGGRNELLYFFGFESAYQFKLSDKIGLGPMFDVHLIQDDVYYIGGFQMGFYF
jgi:hypothetical protein